MDFIDNEPVDIVFPDDIPFDLEVDPRWLQAARKKCAKGRHTFKEPDGAVNFSSDGVPKGTPIYRCIKCGHPRFGQRSK
jgi:hypothetical protein